MKKKEIVFDEKAKIYELFANIFAKEPSEEFLRLFHKQDNSLLFASCDIDPFSDIQHLSLKEQVEVLAVEYTGLFLTPSEKRVTLYESLLRGESRLWGESTIAVKRIYEKFGFVVDDYFQEAPDHVSVELSFLAQLCVLETQYTQKGLQEAVQGVLAVKKYFFKNHLLRWFFDFQNEIDKNATLLYYRAMSHLVGVVLNLEWENLKDIQEIVEQQA